MTNPEGDPNAQKPGEGRPIETDENAGVPQGTDDGERGRHKEDDQFDRKKPVDDTTAPAADDGESGGAGEAA